MSRLMRPPSEIGGLQLVLSFALGACASAAAPALAEPSPETASPGPTVVHKADHPSAVAPHKKASVWHLARGEQAYVGRLRLEADAAVPLHRDATEEYIHVLEGGGTIQVEGETHELRPGSTVYMPANAEVQFQNGSTPMVALQIFAGPAPASKYSAWDRP